MATGGREEDPHICAVCLGSFRNPKFLPCHHTFCAPCIQDVADRHLGGDFPCPSCRRVTSLPPEGVASLQTNFYLQPQTPQQKPDTQDMCKIHPDEKLRFYCVKCHKAICLNCKLTKHERHKTDDLTSVAFRKKKELWTHQQRLQNALPDVMEGVTSLEEERESLDKERAAVEKSIDNRYDVIVAAAERKRNDELHSLQSLHANLNKNVSRAIEQGEDHTEQLLDLLQQVNHAVISGTASEIVTVARKMTIGRGSQLAVDAMISQKERRLHGLVLQCSVNTDVMIQTTCDYLGNVNRMKRETRPGVRVTERFQCAQDLDVQVFSLCYDDTDPPVVYVSYERCGMNEDAPRKVFTETGKCVGTGSGELVGKLSYKRYAKGKVMYTSPHSHRFSTYCKSPTAAHFRLDNWLSGHAVIQRETVTSTDPFETETKPVFLIQVDLHRAFDVDDREHYFAVVEEAKESTAWRSVRLYQRSVGKAVSTYTPPTAEYQPSDVCFYTLGGQKVLLITDELNDAIHVVSIQGETMRFKRYLCAGSPSLIQPTAITVDVDGRLWVACRGGAVLMMEQIT